MTTTLFTWGYYGWGNHTPDLVRAVDAVEASRGFQPPIFADIRIRRSVRAAGFTGPAFERLLGPDRHLWMKSLGNSFIVTRTGAVIQIADPTAADELLDLAIESSRRNQRLLFFCSCQWPRCAGAIACHRATVAGLVQEAGGKAWGSCRGRGVAGRRPKRIKLDVSPKDFAAIQKGRTTVPLGQQFDLPELAGLSWASLATLHSGGKTLHRVVGPAVCQSSGWALPVLYGALEPSTGLDEYEQEAKKLRIQWGLEAAWS